MTKTPGTARDAILTRVRQKLGSDNSARAKPVAQRLANHPRGLTPRRGQGDQTARRKSFSDQAKALGVSLDKAATRGEVGRAVARYLKQHSLASRIWLGADKRLAQCGFNELAMMETLNLAQGLAHPEGARAGVSYALSGIAETGTLMLVSGPDNPVSISFLSEHHIVILDAADIDGVYEDGLDRARAEPGGLARSINFITGPSRTADIEQVIHHGAHGPKFLHVIIVEG